MRCPYPNCRKDYNDSWSKVYDQFIKPRDFGSSIVERTQLNRAYLITRRCRFCHQYFHEFYIGKEKISKDTFDSKKIKELVASYPISKTKFSAKKVPKEVIENFHEAERCRGVGSLTGTGACLRKTVYSLCDNLSIQGEDYREKIAKLPVKKEYSELLKQIKWLGDRTTKTGEPSYTMEMADIALEMLPILVDSIYEEDEKIETAQKLLAKARSIGAQKK